MKRSIIEIVRNYTSAKTRRQIIKLTRWPPVGLVNFGSFSRIEPISREWGLERGKPIDRYFIEKFLSKNSQVIRGRVLEIGDNTYTLMFADAKLEKSDVLHVAENRPGVTIIGDLSSAENITTDSFDCIILTQTLQLIFDVPAVINTLYRILKPGGCALVTVPGISQISRYDMDRWGDYWRFTTRSAEKLFATCFPIENLVIEAYGNVKTSTAFLYGIAHDELRRKDLDYTDPDYQMLISIKATKPGKTDENTRS